MAPDWDLRNMQWLQIECWEMNYGSKFEIIIVVSLVWKDKMKVICATESRCMQMQTYVVHLTLVFLIDMLSVQCVPQKCAL